MIIVLLLATGCDWDFSPNPTSTYEEQLPEITTTGEQTFGCKIDGEVFLPKFSSFMTDQSLYSYGKFSKENGYFEIAAKNQDWKKNGCSGTGSWVEIDFYLDSNKKIKNKAFLKFLECSKKSEGIINDSYQIYSNIIIKNSKDSNSFEIVNYDTTDSENIIFSCIFNGIVEAENGDKKRITDGRFDVKIRKRDY